MYKSVLMEETVFGLGNDYIHVESIILEVLMLHWFNKEYVQ
jgi:hypothetical protein